MMMKKTTSALAVAALLGTGAASAATFQVNDDASISIGGGFFMAYTNTTDESGVDQTAFADNGSDLIFSGEHNAENGLTTFFNLDLDGFDTTTADSSAQGNVVDEASIGVSGSFGSVLLGSNTSAYDSYADFADIEQVGDRTTFGQGDLSDVIQYSNTIDNLEFLVSVEVGDNEAAGESKTALGLGASMDLGGLTLSGAYEDRAAGQDEPVYGIGVSTNVSGLDVTLGHEINDNDGTNGIDKTSLTGAYTVGATTVTGSYQTVNYDNVPVIDLDDDSLPADVNTAGEDSFTELYFGVAHSVTAQMSVYGEMMTRDLDDDAGDYTAVGVNYSW